jgi:hypothetical protein
VVAFFLALFGGGAVLGLGSGCLTHLGPDIRATGYHGHLARTDPDDDCLVCHEPELAAHRRLMAMTEARRQETIAWMEREGGAALVAQWMIDDPRGCQACHALRGSGG